MNNEFYKYATKHRGINGLGLEKYANTITSYISPTIIEERQLNVAQMDVFSRLMMWGSLVGCHLWGLTESDTTEVT